jgi:putative ABC transport system permease protein
MKWHKLIVVALKSIARNKMRSLLTMLGIIIGVASVITMVALGEGSQRDIEGDVASLGTNLLMVRPGSIDSGGVSGGAGSRPSLTMDDVARLTKNATLLRWVSAEVKANGQVIAGNNNWSTTITGVAPNYLSIRNYEMESGAFFTARDCKTRAKVAVLGKTVADELFPDSDPVGERLRIRNVPFKVIGVMAEKGQSSMGNDQDDVIFAPDNTVLYRLSNGKTIHDISASAIDAESMDAAKEELTTLLRSEHRLSADAEDDFEIRDQTEIVEIATRVTGTLTLLLSSIAGVSLLVGGIGIMNIMLVSVTERTREIGLRLAIGARPFDILAQFLTEAAILSLIGGLLGILGGISAAWGVGMVLGVSAAVNPSIMLITVLFTGAVGVFFGFYPARKAANLNPIDALRYE